MVSWRTTPAHLALFFAVAVVVVISYNVWLASGDWSLTDLPTHAVKLYFLETVGYGGTTHQWSYGVGYTLFSTYPPLFFFPSLLFHKAATALGMIVPHTLIHALTFTIALTSLLMLMVIHRLILPSWEKASLFFLLLFFNPLSINAIFESGRYPEFFGWLFFIILFGWAMRRFNQSLSLLDLAVLSILFGLLMLAHPAVFIMGAIFWIIFIVSPRTHSLTSILPLLGGLFLSAWWWIPYQEAKKQLVLSQFIGFTIVPENIFTNGFNVVAVLGLVVAAMAAWKMNHDQKIFFGLFGIMGMAELTGIFSFIPLLNQPSQPTYFLLFLLVGLYGMFRMDWPRLLPGNAPKLLQVGVVFILLLSSYSIIKFHDFAEKNKKGEKWREEMDTLAVHITGPYACLENCGTEIAYWTVEHGLYTIDNFSPEATPISISEKENLFMNVLNAGDCTLLKTAAIGLGVEYVLLRPSSCMILKGCGMPIRVSTKNWCIWGR
jgi:hypothetical protein